MPLPGGKRESLYGAQVLIINDEIGENAHFCQGGLVPLGRMI